jgi:hypothetical protein
MRRNAEIPNYKPNNLGCVTICQCFYMCNNHKYKKVIPAHVMKPDRQNNGTVPFILSWHLMGVNGQLHAPATLPPGKNPSTH